MTYLGRRSSAERGSGLLSRGWFGSLPYGLPGADDAARGGEARSPALRSQSPWRMVAGCGVYTTTVDHEGEILKIAATLGKERMHSRLLIRLRTDDSAAQCQMSAKYGAELFQVHSAGTGNHARQLLLP